MKKISYGLITLLLLGLGNAACGSKKGEDKPLTIWVGTECVNFYTQKMESYKASYEAKEGKAFPNFEVKGVDAGAAAANYLTDTEAGADIFTIPHDNLGKLASGTSSIYPIQGDALLQQIENDNPDAFKAVIKSTLDSGNTYTFGVPYIAQSLVYYYNKDIVSEANVGTWEGIMADCKKYGADVKATSLLGTDGYNNSFLLLARKVENPGEANETTTTTVKIYENGEKTNNYCSGDDTVSVMKWGQKFFADPNGGKITSSSGWAVDLSEKKSAGVIGGAWNYESAKSAIGESKLGVAILPRFTITEDEAYGTIQAGTIFQSGTFADCKMFVLKKGSAYQDLLEDVVMYLSSKEVQEEAFSAVANLPAYKNATAEFAALTADTLDAKLAACQLDMFEYGISQPFGKSIKYNNYYYQVGAPENLRDLLINDKNAFGSFEAIKAELEQIAYVWSHGKRQDA